MNIKLFKGYWTCEDVLNNPDCLFVFGDNDIGKGKKGQAIIRGLENTFGIPTKKIPALTPNAFYNDNEYDDNVSKIDNAINGLIEKAKGYKTIFFPENPQRVCGIGTGLADLPNKAPRTY